MTIHTYEQTIFDEMKDEQSLLGHTAKKTVMPWAPTEISVITR